MLHIYRQIAALERVSPVVIAEKRENADRFPFDKIDIVPKPTSLHSLRRAVVDLGCDENKIDIVRTGIPLEEFPFRERDFPTNGEWRIVQACRLIEKKGLATALHAFTNFLAQYPNATLTIAGAGPLL